MATIQASPPATTKSVKASRGPQTRTFHLPVHKFRAHPQHKPQAWVVLTVPYAEVEHLVKAKQWSFLDGRGEQRELSPSWVRKLYRDMRAGEYTPAPWSASVRKVHADKMVLTESEGTSWVDLTVTSTHPLAEIDGNHRDKAMEMLIVEARKVLSNDRATSDAKREAQEVIDCVMSSEVTVKVYLDHERIKRNFNRLQQGRPISRNEERMRKVRDRDLPEEKQPIADMASAVTVKLAKNNRDSHLYQLVAFGQSAANLVGFDVLTKDSGSELSCSIYAGADIAIGHGKDAEWLEKCYVEAFQIVENFTQAVELPTPSGTPEREIPSVLQTGKILCPAGSTYNGKKGGSILIVGIGNLWAFYQLLMNRKQPTQEDKQRLAKCVDDVFDAQFAGGLNAPLKRQLMGDFARELFDGIVLGEEEAPKQGKVPGNEGVPLPLLNFIPPSAFGIKRQVNVPSLPDDNYNLDDEDEEVGYADGENGTGNGNGKVSVSPGNRKALAKAQQA